MRSKPPSPIPAMATVRYPPSSKRTTASSEQSIATTSTSPSGRRRDRQGSIPPPYAGPVTNYSATLPDHTVRVAPRGERTRMPFPQSPPGSGYPLMLAVDPPRAPALDSGTSQSKVREANARDSRSSNWPVVGEEAAAIPDRPGEGVCVAQWQEGRQQAKMRLSSPPLTDVAEVVAAGPVRHGTLGIYRHIHGLDDSGCGPFPRSL